MKAEDKKTQNQKQIEFLKLMYYDIKADEYIRLFFNNAKNTKVVWCNSLDKVTEITNKYKYVFNSYFTLATTKKDKGKADDLLYRYCIALDFDKKQQQDGFNYIDVLNRCKNIGITYHALIDSGNGYHVYFMINKTNDFEKVQKVTKILAFLLGADSNATNSTQILRLPGTMNLKDKSNKKNVNLMYIDSINNTKFKRYDIEALYKRFCNDKYKRQEEQETINFTDVPVCIKALIDNGSVEGQRYLDLQNIVVALRNTNKSLNEVMGTCEEWAKKSNFDDNLKYRVESIYYNKKQLSINCTNCMYKTKCRLKTNAKIYDFDFRNGENTKEYDVFNVPKKAINNVVGGKGMSISGNELLILNVIKNNNADGGITNDELKKKITFKKQQRLSDKTLRETIRSLEEQGFITKVNGAKRNKETDLFVLNEPKSKGIEGIQTSYLATAMCVCRLISPSELKLYYVMRYLHRTEQEEKGTKGNLFQINQEKLAYYYYGYTNKKSQGNISNMINNLIECHILEIWERCKSKNNGYDYYIYRLNS